MNRSATRPPSSPVADDIALLLHTSGTTARPKLVPLRQRNLLASAAAVAHALGLTPDDRGLAVMPLFHIHGIVGSLLSSVWAGATLRVTPFDPFRFQTLLASERITWTSAVPTMYQTMLLRPAVELPGTLRLARSSSSPLSTQTWTSLQERLECAVVNSYGMTEASHQMASTPPSGDSTFFGWSAAPPGRGSPSSLRLASRRTATVNSSSAVMA